MCWSSQLDASSLIRSDRDGCFGAASCMVADRRRPALQFRPVAGTLLNFHENIAHDMKYV